MRLIDPSSSLRAVGGNHKAGFSLMEVTLAIGVVSFAFMSILGLLPVGMTDFRSSIDSTVGAQIGQQMMNQAQETDFSALPLLSGSVMFFDVDGRRLANATGAVYQARVSVTQAPLLPGADTGNPSIASVTVQIASNPANQQISTDPNTNLWTALPGVPMRTYSTVVSGCGAIAVTGT